MTSGPLVVRESFRRQAESCHKLGSPFTGRLLNLLAERLQDDHPVGGIVLNWPSDPVADALALRLAGALHALVLTRRSPSLARIYPPDVPVDDGDLWQALANAFDEHGDAVLTFIETPPQTNEVARSAALAGGFHAIAAATELPIAIFEIGASAGLNLHWDRFGYDLGGRAIRKSTGRPLLAPDWQGPSPPAADVRVVERAGCDRAPIDVHSPDEILRLRAYVWPDQPDRLSRLDQALAVARASTVVVERADAADWAEDRLRRRREGIATVVYHSIFWQYLTSESRSRLQRTIDEAGARADPAAPLAWLRMEPETREAAALRLTLWPGGSTLFLADVDYHGRWIRWHVDETSQRSFAGPLTSRPPAR